MLKVFFDRKDFSIEIKNNPANSRKGYKNRTIIDRFISNKIISYLSGFSIDNVNVET